MPEYLAPGVYVEETSFRAKSIEGVPTSTTGMAGLTRYGPVQQPGGPLSTEPRLITSFTEFERVYGGLEPLELDGVAQPPYLAHAARAFFNNGGKRLYVSRVYRPMKDAGGNDILGRSELPIPIGGKVATWRARWPGDDGEVMVETQVGRSRNLGFTHALVAGDPLARHTWGAQAKGLRSGALVETHPAGTTVLPGPNATLDPATLFVVEVDRDGRQRFLGQAGGPAVSLADNTVLLLVELRVTVRHGNPAAPKRVDVYEALAASKSQTRYIGTVLQRDDPQDENATLWLDWQDDGGFDPASLAIALQTPPGTRLTGGNDGAPLSPDDLAGKPADPDDAAVKATGLEALAEIDDIAIVAAPDAAAMAEPFSAAEKVVVHAEQARYRIAVIDGPVGSSINEIREFRGKFDSKYAALYHPWIEILDPLAASAPGVPQPRLLLPPSGFVCGIYARIDIERGVHKAPANEIVRGLTRFEVNINKPRQDVLNPEGVNCLRFFEGRGNRVWGARTVSSDPEWKYVNVRRLFIYLEHSIDKASQWAVFEPNNERLWGNIRRTVEDFLFVLWRDGALLGSKPEEAFFVRCDRSTMTQNDLDNGRMICLIGVAPVRPAEFVIFRVGQWTGDASR
jgi:uncharacterized protein